MEHMSTISPASPIYATPSFLVRSPVNRASSVRTSTPFGNVHSVGKLSPIDTRTSATSASNSQFQSTPSPVERYAITPGGRVLMIIPRVGFRAR